MSDGIVRRHVDARLVSFAMAVLKQENQPSEIFKTFEICATSALQAASGMVALTLACQSAADSPVFIAKLDGAQAERIKSLLSGLGATLQDTWFREIKELLEVIVVLAAESASSSEDEFRFRQWAKGVLLDTRPMSIMEDDTQADVEMEQEPEPQRQRIRKVRNSKQLYQQERLETLVSQAIVMGVSVMKPELISGNVVIQGINEKGQTKTLGKVRGSRREADALCQLANEEIRKYQVAEPTY